MIDAEILARWHLAPLRPLGGGHHNRHWLVRTGEGAELVLRRYRDDHLPDLAYEFEVMRRLREQGWPVPELTTAPVEHGGTTWCLMTRLPGVGSTAPAVEEQRRRGRLLAELHDSCAQLTDLGQRRGWEGPEVRVRDPGLLAAVRRYEALRPEEGHLLRWHLERAVERFAELDPSPADSLVLHGDFVGRNLLFVDEELSGIVDFEATHLSLRVSEFALSWRGRYDEVVCGYEEVHPLSDLERSLLVPVFWSWLFLGVRDGIESLGDEQLRRQAFAWPVKQLRRRSPLFGDLAAPYPGRPG